MSLIEEFARHNGMSFPFYTHKQRTYHILFLVFHSWEKIVNRKCQIDHFILKQIDHDALNIQNERCHL